MSYRNSHDRVNTCWSPKINPNCCYGSSGDDNNAWPETQPRAKEPWAMMSDSARRGMNMRPTFSLLERWWSWQRQLTVPTTPTTYSTTTRVKDNVIQKILKAMLNRLTVLRLLLWILRTWQYFLICRLPARCSNGCSRQFCVPLLVDRVMHWQNRTMIV